MIGTAIQSALVAIIPNTFAQIVLDDVAVPYCLHSEYETPLRLKNGLVGYSYEIEIFIVDTTPELVKTKTVSVVAAIEALAELGGWGLCSQIELQTLLAYEILILGQVKPDRYWSSTESSATRAISVLGVNSPTSTLKTTALKSRLCRKIVAAAGTYSLGDPGPSGGIIFYVDGTNFYESSPSDIDTSSVWSNIADVALATTSDALGQGRNNTKKIINQAGHTASAAKLCDDYDVYDTRIENVTYEGDSPGFDPESGLYGNLLRFTIETANR